MDIREIAAEIYKSALNNGTKGYDAEFSSAQDKAFVKRLVLTTLRRQEFLRNILKPWMAKPMPAKLSNIHQLILLGTTEILYFRTPEYAVVSSYVNLAKKSGGKSVGGFVNALLHKVCKNKDEILKTENKPFFPKGFYQLLNTDYDKNQIKAMEQASACEPPLDITVKSNAYAWAEKLGGTVLPNKSIRIFSAGAVSSLNGYTDGQWWVQDMASSLAVPALGNIKGLNVLELCAAPGGKTAQLLSGGANVTALDISSSRLQTMEENLNRLNLHTSKTVCADALDFLKNSSSFYDIILLDAPCSATGTLRRHPEIVHTRTNKDVQQSAAIQKQILESAAQKLQKQGLLLYSVCSLSKAEGERQIKNFISTHKDFKIKPINPELIAGSEKNKIEMMITEEGFIRCLPSYLPEQGGLDGFFIACLQKVN